MSFDGLDTLGELLEKAGGHRYIRRWKNKKGEWEYEYAKEKIKGKSEQLGLPLKGGKPEKKESPKDKAFLGKVNEKAIKVKFDTMAAKDLGAAVKEIERLRDSTSDPKKVAALSNLKTYVSLKHSPMASDATKQDADKYVQDLSALTTSDEKKGEEKEGTKQSYKEGERVSYQGQSGTVKWTQGDLTMVEFDGSGTTGEGILTERLSSESEKKDPKNPLTQPAAKGPSKQVATALSRRKEATMPQLKQALRRASDGNGYSDSKLQMIADHAEKLRGKEPAAAALVDAVKGIQEDRKGEEGPNPIAGQTPSGKDIPRVPKPDSYYKDWTSADHAKASLMFEGKESAEGHGSDMRQFHSNMMNAANAAELKDHDPGFRKDADKFRRRANKKIREYAKEIKKSMTGLDALGDVLEKALPSTTADVSPEKARKILHDGEVHGKPLTEQQRKFFGAIGGHLPAPGKKMKKADDGKPGESLGETSTEELQATHKDLAHRMKQKPEDKALQARHEAILAELKKRGTDKMSKGLDALGDVLEKSKYTKRTGTPGNYKYEYAERKTYGRKGNEGGEKKKAGYNAGNKPKIGAELLLTTATGKMDNYVVAKVTETGVELAKNKASKPVWATTWSGLNRAISRATGSDKQGEGPKAFRQAFKEYRQQRPRSDGTYATGTQKESPESRSFGISHEEAMKIMREVKAELEKSMTNGLDEMGEILEKAGLPTHQANKLGYAKSNAQGGSADGGDLDGTGKTSGDPSSGPGPGQDAQGQITGAPKPTKKKLSEDEEDDEKQLKPHKKPIELIKKSISPQDIRDTVAYETAVAASRARKGPEDVQVAEAHPYSVNHIYGNGDVQASELAKGNVQAPTMGPADSVLRKSIDCGCGHTHSAMYTACPDCGNGTTAHRLMPNGIWSQNANGVTLEKANYLRPLRQPDDLYIPEDDKTE